MPGNGRELHRDDDIRELLQHTGRIAVLGIKPETHRSRPAYYVPKYMQDAGYEIIPVPVYYPEVTEILGMPVVRSLAEIEEPVDMVNLFRRPQDIPKHIEEIIAAKPRSVWMQLGIRHDRAADAFITAGIDVVQDRCILVEHRALLR